MCFVINSELVGIKFKGEIDMRICELNDRFSIPGELIFTDGPGKLPVVKISNAHATAEIALHGGHIMSYIPVDEKPVLWMSDSSWFLPEKPIRGGIPVCWPWFGGHPDDKNLPSHGFARISDWHVEMTEKVNDATRIVLKLTQENIAKNMPQFPFELRLDFMIGADLQVALGIKNNGTENLSFTAALHTYFNISEISKIKITGLEQCRFLDTLDHTYKIQTGAITFSEETDRVYLETDSQCIIHDPGFGRRIKVAKSGSNSTVIWNPWIDKSKRMPDFGDNEYLNMACIETTNAENDRRTIHPGERHILKTIISIEK
jgi:D-hexose-6-phosphate mutarotase